MNRLASLFAGFALLAASAVPAFAAGHGSDLIEATSPHDVAKTVEQLVAAIEGAGATVAARIDHAANAASVDTELEPTVLVVFGNPKIGTPIIAADRRAALDLPVRVLVYSEEGQTKLIATAPDTIAERYGITGAQDARKTMAGAIEKLMGAAAK